MNLARMAGLFAMVLALPAQAATVAVAPLRDMGAKRGALEYVRHQIESGLTDGGLVVIGSSALAAAAKKQGLSPGALGQPAVLMPVAKAAGADAVLTGTLDAKTFDIRVFSLDGVELWSRPIKLSRGHLAPDIPRKIARAVSAAIAAAPSSSGTSDGASASAAGNAAIDAAGGTDSSSADSSDSQSSDSSAQASSDASSDQDTGGSSNGQDNSSASDDNQIVTPKHDAQQVAMADDSSNSSTEGDVAIEGPPKEAAVDTRPAPPIIDVGVGFALLTRNYQITPNNASDFSGGGGPSYKTGAPGGGLVIRAELFPVPHLWQISDGLTFTLGATAEYIYGFGETDQGLDASGAPAQSSSRITRFSADATARLYFDLLDGTGYAGLYGGALLPSFTVGENALATPSTRKGFDIGVRAELPLAANYVKLAVQGAIAPSDNPGVTETTDYGQTGVGKGWLFRGGLEGDYKFIGYGAYVDIAQFSDTFDGAGDLTTNGATSSEGYMTYFLMVRGCY